MHEIIANLELAARGELGHACRGAGAAGRAVDRLVAVEHRVAGMGARIARHGLALQLHGVVRARLARMRALSRGRVIAGSLAHRAWRAEGRLRTPDDLREAIVEGAAHRIRPKLMTVLTMMIGLMPVLWSTGTGADVMKRIAAPMIGGLVTSFVLELLVYPAVFAWWKGRDLPDAAIPTAELSSPPPASPP